ncbi:MAG TPA: hypothetical protein VGE22_00630, partial [Solimonas sp.]
RLAHEHHDACVSCRRSFREGDTTHWGYLGNGTPSYVCDDCAGTLAETASRIYFMPHPYSVPDPAAKLWRYMDFTKYVSLLSSRSLYFARADSFDDTFEGAKGLRKNKKRWDDHYSDFFRKAIRNPPEGYKFEMAEEEVEAQASRLLRDMETGGEYFRKRNYINCWHENDHESEAMWRLYSSFLPNAVVVRSTYGALYRSLGRNPDIKIGRVQYIDLKTSYAGVNDAFWRKRKSFEHEREVRALTLDFRSAEPGKLMPCDLSVLIEQVYVSPRSPGWFVALVNDVNEKYGLPLKVSTSELIEEAFF